MQAKSCEHRQVACLDEEIQVVQGELLSHWGINLNQCLVFFAITVVRGKLDETVTGGTLD